MRRTRFKNLELSDKPEINHRRWPPEYYLEEEHKVLSSVGDRYHSLYSKAMDMEIHFSYQFDMEKPETILEKIKEELKIRTKITAHEAFKIGELLYHAKKACKACKMTLQSWIEENCDFKYRTGNNCMHVFKYCLGMRSIAINIPVSLLYKLSAPNFPEMLREYLFEHANIEEMTNHDLDDIISDYHSGGFGAIRERIMTWNRRYHLSRQTKFALDMIRHVHNTADLALNKLEDRYGPESEMENEKQEELYKKFKTITDAKVIRMSILCVLKECRNKLGDEIRRAEEKLDAFDKSIEMDLEGYEDDEELEEVQNFQL